MYHTKILFLLVVAAWISTSSQEKLTLTIYSESRCPDCHNFILNQLVPGYKVLGDYVVLEFVPYGFAQEKLTLTIYGESRCPDTQNFILNQLVPGYKVLGDYVILEFVPYGFAHRTTVNGKTTFTCQHGPNECIGNTIQACALNFATSQEDKLDFMRCTTTDNPENLDLAKKCGEEIGITWESLEACINGPLGEQLSNQMGDLTEKANPDDVPLITVNGTGDDSTSFPIRRNFMSICSYYHEKPSGCP